MSKHKSCSFSTTAETRKRRGKRSEYDTSVMPTSKVVGSILFARDELFRVKELAIISSSNFIDDSRLKIHKDSSGDMLTGTSLTEEGIEGIVASTKCGVTDF